MWRICNTMDVILELAVRHCNALLVSTQWILYWAIDTEQSAEI